MRGRSNLSQGVVALKILVITLVLAIVCILMAAVPSFSGEAPPVSGQVTFLYFEDLERASKFYGQTLGLKATTDLDWVKIYEVSAGSSVGLVSATGGTHRPSKDKPVMVSLVVDDADAWYAYLPTRTRTIRRAVAMGGVVTLGLFFVL